MKRRLGRLLLSLFAVAFACLSPSPAPAGTVLASCSDPAPKLHLTQPVMYNGLCLRAFTLTGTYPIVVEVHFDLTNMTYGQISATVKAGAGGVHPCPPDDSCGAGAQMFLGEDGHTYMRWNMNPGAFKAEVLVSGYGGYSVTLSLV
jgi:hypothetical protein